VGPRAHTDTLENRNISICVMNQTLVIPQSIHYNDSATWDSSPPLLQHYCASLPDGLSWKLVWKSYH